MKPTIKRQSVNQLLNSLEAGAFERVAKKLTRVKLRPKQVVYKPNEPIDCVFFPENVVLCLMTLMSNGDTIEAATVGREGASWISASVGAPSMPRETIVVIEGTALRLPVADLDRELKENGYFRDVLTAYSHALLIASMRTSACNGLHGLQERCALDPDDARPRGFRPLRRDERVPRATIGHEPTHGERAGLGTRKGGNSQRGRPLGHPGGSKSSEGSGLRMLRRHPNELRSSR
jgi:hypothetical protein